MVSIAFNKTTRKGGFFDKKANNFQKPIAIIDIICYNNTVNKSKKIYAKIIYDLSRVAEGRAL